MRNFVLAVCVSLAASWSLAQDTQPSLPDTATVNDTVAVAVTTANHDLKVDVSSGAEPFAKTEKREGSVYKLRPGFDIPYTLAATAWSLYGFSQIYSKDPSTQEEISALRMSDINGFDRWAADLYSEKAAKASDAFFYGSMPFPIVLMFDGKIRKDALKVGFLWWETMATTGIFYTGTAYLVDRYRPLAYNPEAPMEDRLSGNAKNSFLGGHPALVASSTFFTAKVFSDYNPHSKLKWVFWTVAGGSTFATAYLRHRGGKHFPSDLIVGVAMGTAVGILVPHWHKNPLFKDKNLSLKPFTGMSHGLVMTYKFQ